MASTSGAHATLACGECSVLLSIEQVFSSGLPIFDIIIIAQAEQHSCSTVHHFECPFCRSCEQSQEALERHLVGCAKLPQGTGTTRQQAVRSVVLTGTIDLDFHDLTNV